MSKVNRFEQEAMKTTFGIRLVTDDKGYASELASECFRLIEEIEGKLSRYRPGSDIWQINHMQTSESLFLSDTCYDCLRLAFEMYEASAGLFDVTLGSRIEHRKNEDSGEAPEITGHLLLDPDRPVIHCVEPGREIDLGGIGKGFALDRLRDLILSTEKIETVLLSAGNSTQLAFGKQAWPIHLKGEFFKHTVDLHNKALSVSGSGIQGSHIISPAETGIDYTYPRIWILDTLAARADAWSTAAMCMEKQDLVELSSAGLELYVDAETQPDEDRD